MRKTSMLLALVLAGCGDRASSQDAPAESSPVPSAASQRRMLALAEPPPGKLAAAIVSGQKAAREHPTSAPRWVALGRTWVRQARVSGDAGWYRSAGAAAELALELEPQNAAALDLRGIVLLNDHRFTEAAELARQILARDADDAMALGILSDALLELGDLAGAEAAADRMMERKPDLPSYSRFGHLRWLRGDVDGALQALRLAYDAGRGQKDPEPAAWVLNELARIFWHKGDLEGAAEGHRLALALMPNYPAAETGLARIALVQKDYPQAVERLERAQRDQPLVETASLLAEAQELAGDAAAAAKTRAELVRLGKQTDPRSLALHWATRGEEPEAALALSRGEYEKRPGPYVRDAHAFALLRAGKPEEARAVLAPVLELGVRDASIWFHAGSIELALGNEKGGKKYLRDALALQPHFDLRGAAEARRLLER